MDWLKLLNIIASAAIACVTAFVIPWIQNNMSIANQEKVTKIIDVLVQAAEQQFGASSGDDKIEAVKKWLVERGLNADIQAIEAAVLRLHAAGLNYTSVHPEAAIPEIQNSETVDKQ